MCCNRRPLPKATPLRIRWETTDAEGVLAVIQRQSLCVPCIVERSQVSPGLLQSILVALSEPLEIRRSYPAVRDADSRTVSSGSGESQRY